MPTVRKAEAGVMWVISGSLPPDHTRTCRANHWPEVRSAPSGDVVRREGLSADAHDGAVELDGDIDGPRRGRGGWGVREDVEVARGAGNETSWQDEPKHASDCVVLRHDEGVGSAGGTGVVQQDRADVVWPV
jgi:hypothetical protein